MSHDLIAVKITFGADAGKWTISDDQLTNRTWGTQEACETVIANLEKALPDLLLAADIVIDSWEEGNLPRALRELAAVLKEAWGQQ